MRPLDFLYPRASEALQSLAFLTKNLFYLFFWRSGRDSNPRGIAPKLISSALRQSNFGRKSKTLQAVIIHEKCRKINGLRVCNPRISGLIRTHRTPFKNVLKSPKKEIVLRKRRELRRELQPLSRFCFHPSEKLLERTLYRFLLLTTILSERCRP